MKTCLKCPTPLSRSATSRAAAGRKTTGLCHVCYVASVKKARSCCECGAQLARHGAIRCQPCNNRLMATDVVRETRRIANARAAFWRPEVREKHNRAIAHAAARKMSWCPDEYRLEYRRQMKRVGAASAKAIILAQLSPFERQLARVAAGARLVESFRPVKAEHSFTLGGVSGGML